MNQTVFSFRCYEDASLSYLGYASHAEQQCRENLRHTGLYDTVITLKIR